MGSCKQIHQQDKGTGGRKLTLFTKNRSKEIVIYVQKYATTQYSRDCSAAKLVANVVVSSQVVESIQKRRKVLEVVCLIRQVVPSSVVRVFPVQSR